MNQELAKPANREDRTLRYDNPANCVVLCDKCAGFCSEEAIGFPKKEELKELLQKLLEQVREKTLNQSSAKGA